MPPTHSSLIETLIERRSRRFGKGMTLNGGPLAYSSHQKPEPLSIEEEAMLAFAACGVNGPVLSELPFQTGDVPDASGGYIMVNFVGRTIASGDAMHLCTVFVVNDQGAWLLRRPQDYPRGNIAGLLSAARDHRFVELYEKARVKLADCRVDIPRQVPFIAPFNKWSANVPGTTYFVPVAELTVLYINVLLSFFDEEWSFFFLDDHNGYQPAGIAKFARSKGGHLYDDPHDGRVATVSLVERWMCEFGTTEMGSIAQNLGLMAAAIGVGGFPHFAAYPGLWPSALGFRMENVPLPKTMGMGPGNASDIQVATPVGLEKEGSVLIKPFCPPYYKNMEEAVLAFIDYKYAQGKGTFRDGGAATAWKDGEKIQAGIPKYSDKTIAATIAYATYVFERYGRFPGTTGPFSTLIAYQAHHVDPEFYEKFYRPGVLTKKMTESS
jgi:hypothetical protein